MTHKKAPLILLIALLLSISSFSVSCGARKARTAVIETDLGNIKIELLEDDAPETVENFRQLAQRGAYDGTIFHRVISGFMIQGGDPKGDGSGGETAGGQGLADEAHPAAPVYTAGDKRGGVGMAHRRGPGTTRTHVFI